MRLEKEPLRLINLGSRRYSYRCSLTQQIHGVILSTVDATRYVSLVVINIFKLRLISLYHRLHCGTSFGYQQQQCQQVHLPQIVFCDFSSSEVFYQDRRLSWICSRINYSNLLILIEADRPSRGVYAEQRASSLHSEVDRPAVQSRAEQRQQQAAVV